MSFLDTLQDQSEKIQLSLIKDKIESLKIDIENEVTGEVLDNLLYLLLNTMSLLFLINKDYRKNKVMKDTKDIRKQLNGRTIYQSLADHLGLKEVK